MYRDRVGTSVCGTFRAVHDDGAVGDLTVCATATLTINRYATSLALPITDETLARLADERLPA